MIASDPCPNCGSSAVRWRGRRIYDGVFTEIRHAADNALGAFFGANKTSVAGGAYSERADEARLDTLRYQTERKIYENRVGTVTAVRFWKCRACQKKGEVFEDAAGLLAGRAHLVELENDIAGNLGAVSHPIANTKVDGD